MPTTAATIDLTAPLLTSYPGAPFPLPLKLLGEAAEEPLEDDVEDTDVAPLVLELMGLVREADLDNIMRCKTKHK
jgi:hypothetical protein